MALSQHVGVDIDDVLYAYGAQFKNCLNFYMR